MAPVVLPSPQALKSPSLMGSREQARSARETNEKHKTGMIPGTSEKRAGIFSYNVFGFLTVYTHR